MSNSTLKSQVDKRCPVKGEKSINLTLTTFAAKGSTCHPIIRLDIDGSIQQFA